MAGEAHNSDLILRQARQSLAQQRAGGRRAVSIGQRSAAYKAAHFKKKLARLLLAVGAIVFAAMVAGLVVNGIGWGGIILTLLAIGAAVTVFSAFPRIEVPSLTSLKSGDTKSLVARTELWLERQRPALPAPAVTLVDRIGVQLDALGLQLDGIDAQAPAAVEVRALVGEHLPGLVSAYTSIPRHLRAEGGSGQSPDAHLTESLGKISAEIDSVTRQLASGAIDNLAIQTRYLDYKYGAALDDKQP